MKLIVDCTLTHALSALPQHGALADLLSKGNKRWYELPLEAQVSTEFGLQEAWDLPIAAVSASTDGLDVGGAYWLRAEPVHLVLQRDGFSLNGSYPLSLERGHAESLVMSLNQHFMSDGLKFMVGHSGAWYLRLSQAPHIKTFLPEAAVGRDVAQFMPQGENAGIWLGYLNEMQMLLHTHAVNIARESSGHEAVNSLWFSGGGVLPTFLGNTSGVGSTLLAGKRVFYRGLASYAGIPFLEESGSVNEMLEKFSKNASVRWQLSEQLLLDDLSFQSLRYALKSGYITALTMNIGCYDKTLVATIKPSDLYKFWRKTKSIHELLR